MNQNQNIPKFVRSIFFRVVALSMLLGACSFFQPSTPSQEEQAEKLEAAMGKGGYAAARSFAIESIHDRWVHDGVELEVVMTAPTVQGSYPLIIYLPGLGEDARAGRLWRETWAKAGYAVFSLQPVTIAEALNTLRREQGIDLEDTAYGRWEDDANSESAAESGDSWFGEKRRRPSREARSSELRYLGHEYFGHDNLQNRMEQLFWAYRQLKTRSGLRQSLFASVDFSKVILAGYDLGAQTASAVVGENFETVLPRSEELKPIAAVLLSPSVSLAQGNVRGRFQALNLPMLVATGTEDNDPYAISSASVKTAVWEYAPVGGKYLLSLKGAGHSLLAGSEMDGRYRRLGRSDQMSPENIGSGRVGGRRETSGIGSAWPDDMMRRFPIEGERTDSDHGYKHVAAIFSVSTAFLDAVAKNDSFASLWLGDKASRWLGKAGSLKRR